MDSFSDIQRWTNRPTDRGLFFTLAANLQLSIKFEHCKMSLDNTSCAIYRHNLFIKEAKSSELGQNLLINPLIKRYENFTKDLEISSNKLVSLFMMKERVFLFKTTKNDNIRAYCLD